MTVSQLAGLYWNAYQVSNNSSYTAQLSADTTAVQKQMGVQDLNTALSLPDQIGDLDAVSNMDAYVSGLYAKSQLPESLGLSATGDQAADTSWNSIGNLNSYAKSLYMTQHLGLKSSSVNLNAVTTANQAAQISQLQSSLQSSPMSVIQLYQNYLSDSYPGLVFSQSA